MTSGSTLTHLTVTRAPRVPQSDSNPLVVADPGALPEKADDRVALVVARQAPVGLEARRPALEQLAGGLVLVGRQDRRRRLAQAGDHGDEVVGRHAAAPVRGHQPLAVV